MTESIRIELSGNIQIDGRKLMAEHIHMFSRSKKKPTRDKRVNQIIIANERSEPRGEDREGAALRTLRSDNGDGNLRSLGRGSLCDVDVSAKIEITIL